MLARLAKGEDPLELSIEKWQDIVDGKGRDYSTKNCALCEVSKLVCGGCLVFKSNHYYWGCDWTPYRDYQEARTKEGRKEAAKKEVEFLESL